MALRLTGESGSERHVEALGSVVKAVLLRRRRLGLC